MKKYKLKKTCRECKGWGKERLASIHLPKGMVIDCSYCKGKGYIEEVVEMEEIK